MQQDYGAKHPEGELLVTSCITVRSFAPELRSAPKLHGEDSFVGYFDYGPGMSRGHIFLVFPALDDANDDIGKLLQAVDPKKREFWLEASLKQGDLASSEPFEAVVPPKQHYSNPNSLIVEREAILMRGSLQAACGKRYLIAVQGNPRASEDSEWPRIRVSYDLFVSNLQWPK